MIDIAVAGNRNAVRWKNTKVSWSDFKAALKDTKRTGETVREYFAMSKDEQDRIKDVGGFVGGYLDGGKRSKNTIKHRQLICLDADFGKLSMWSKVELLELEACMYTTHKHTPKSPRFRVCFPLSRPVNAMEYEFLARLVASWLDIEQFDDTTYQVNRLMYYPSTSSDGEYIYKECKATVLDVDRHLADNPKYKDRTTWAYSSRVKADSVHQAGLKQEDPLTKQGVIGAFCRTFTMTEAIEEFLWDKYAPCDSLGDDRFSLIGASTSGGLVVYDDKFAYSHHSTDVAGEKLCNAFDLVRLHKFGELDKGKHGNLKQGNVPSFAAMSDFAYSIPKVKRALVPTSTVDIFNDEHVQGEEDPEAWKENLEFEKKSGMIKRTIGNTTLILINDERLKGRFGFNEFEQREVAISKLPWDRPGLKYPRPLTDSDDSELRLFMWLNYRIEQKQHITDALTIVVKRNIFNPVRQYLDSLTWDGERRLDTLFVDLFGADDTRYTRAVTRKSLTAAVARIYNPGCKFDNMTVLVGDQGIGKSTLLSKLGKGWFTDSLSSITGGKESLEQVQGSWIIEVGELAGLRKADVDAVKQFMAKSEDRFRVAYGKRVEYFPRRCVFFGTTNDDDFLRDVTGNRRFWVVNCKRRPGTKSVWTYLTPEIVDQIWAEAKERYFDKESLFLPEDIEATARDIQDDHLEKDERCGLVSEYLSRLLPTNWDALDPYQRRAWLHDPGNRGTVKREKVCVMEIWAECFGRDLSNLTRRDSYELGRMLKSLKTWVSSGSAIRFEHYGRQRTFITKESLKPIPFSPIDPDGSGGSGGGGGEKPVVNNSSNTSTPNNPSNKPDSLRSVVTDISLIKDEIRKASVVSEPAKEKKKSRYRAMIEERERKKKEKEKGEKNRRWLEEYEAGLQDGISKEEKQAKLEELGGLL